MYTLNHFEPVLTWLWINRLGLSASDDLKPLLRGPGLALSTETPNSGV